MVKAPSAFIISSARATSNLNRARPTTYSESNYQKLVWESASNSIFPEQKKGFQVSGLPVLILGRQVRKFRFSDNPASFCHFPAPSLLFHHQSSASATNIGHRQASSAIASRSVFSGPKKNTQAHASTSVHRERSVAEQGPIISASVLSLTLGPLFRVAHRFC